MIQMRFLEIREKRFLNLEANNIYLFDYETVVYSNHERKNELN